MPKFYILLLLGLSLTALTAAAPYRHNTWYHFLRDWTGTNDAGNSDYSSYLLEEQNVQENNEENESDESSEETSSEVESDYTSLVAGLSSYFSMGVDPAITDSPVTTPALIATTIMDPVATVPQDETTPVQALPTTQVIDRGDAPAPGVNSPQVNVITTKSSAPTTEKGTTMKQREPDQPVQPVKPTCRTTCPLTSQPVCASDGKEYVSRCVFEAVMCRNNTPEIVIVNEGHCEPKTDTSNLKPGSPVEDFMP